MPRHNRPSERIDLAEDFDRALLKRVHRKDNHEKERQENIRKTQLCQRREQQPGSDGDHHQQRRPRTVVGRIKASAQVKPTLLTMTICRHRSGKIAAISE